MWTTYTSSSSVVVGLDEITNLVYPIQWVLPYDDANEQLLPTCGNPILEADWNLVLNYLHARLPDSLEFPPSPKMTYNRNSMCSTPGQLGSLEALPLRQVISFQHYNHASNFRKEVRRSGGVLVCVGGVHLGYCTEPWGILIVA